MPGCRLCAQRGLEECLRAGVVIALEEERTTSLLRLGLTHWISRLAVEHLRPSIQLLGLGERVQLNGEIGAGERDARPDIRRRSHRVGDTLSAAELVERSLELSGGGE